MVKVIILMMLMVSFSVSADSDVAKDIGFPKEGSIKWEERMPNIKPRNEKLVNKKIKLVKYGNTMILFPEECFMHVELDYEPRKRAMIDKLNLRCPE